MHKPTLLAEAQRLLLEEFVAIDLGGCIDYRTGEILDRRDYATTRYHPLSEPVLPTFTDLRSVAGLSRFLDHIDRRTLVLRDDCRRLYDLDKGRHHLTGRSVAFPTSRYAKLTRLVRRLDYANSIITTPEDLVRHLRIHPKALYRYLGSLLPLVRVRGARDGMAQGTLRVDLHPAYGYRYPRDLIKQARSDAVQSWCRAILQ